MDASPCKVHEIRIPVKCATKKAPCPTCGKLGVRKRKPLHRSVRSIAYQAIVYGSVLIVVIIAFPQGLAGLFQSLTRRRRLPTPRSPESTEARGRFTRLVHFWGN